MLGGAWTDPRDGFDYALGVQAGVKVGRYVRMCISVFVVGTARPVVIRSSDRSTHKQQHGSRPRSPSRGRATGSWAAPRMCSGALMGMVYMMGW